MKLLRDLPKIDKLVALETFDGLNKALLTSIARETIDFLREGILSKKIDSLDEKEIISNIYQKYKTLTTPSLKPLVNATGVILHTNMGRAPLSQKVYDGAKKIACGYSNLEFNVKEGKRGERYEHVSRQLSTLINSEDVLVVNNNAAAVFLVLNTFGKGKNAILSRGELIEIGGSFRIPDVMRESGCELKEIGTTNKTKLSDYENAIDENTSILMKVHKSNFYMKGFTQSVEYGEIVKLAKEQNLIDFYDVGGAYVEDFSHGDRELDLKQIMELKPSLVSFSGDKLFGSVQAGIIVGKRKYIEKLKKNQLLRMLRVDKVTLSLLQESVKAYFDEKISSPTLTLLKRSEDELKELVNEATKDMDSEKFSIVKTFSYVGGGTMPDKTLPSLALHIKGEAKKMQEIFRVHGVIGRIEEEKFLLDFKSVLKRDVGKLQNALKVIL